MKRKTLEKKIRRWQEFFLLHRWKLYAEIVNGRKAKITYDTQELWAIVKIGEDHPKKELDETICHELLHLVLAEGLNEEGIANRLAGVLTEKKRSHLPQPIDLLICVVICFITCAGFHFLL